MKKSAYVERLNKENPGLNLSSVEYQSAVVKDLEEVAKDLIDRMHEYLSELFDASPISFTFTKDVQNPNQSIDLFTRQNTYLIFKESLNNIAKHANATHVNIELVINASALKLAISNNGQSQTNPKPGMGLRNMEMRAKKMKAELTIDPENCYKLILLKKL